MHECDVWLLGPGYIAYNKKDQMARLRTVVGCGLWVEELDRRRSGKNRIRIYGRGGDLVHTREDTPTCMLTWDCDG